MRGLLVRSVIMTWCAFGPAWVPAYGQEDAGDSVVAGPLFTTEAPLSFRIAGALKTLIDDRDSLKSQYHPFTLTYREGDAPPVTLDVEFKTRGHWRRQERHCDFPPLRLDVPRKKVEETLFAGQNRLKLVTPCRPKSGDYREFVLREYYVYKLYNLLTPFSLRARLATATYVDTAGRLDSLTVPTFLLEEPEHMAARTDAQLMPTPGAEFAIMDSVNLGVVGVFLYMIGGTDWSMRALHNMQLVLDVGRGAFVPVAYDFDFTGIVNTSYARPDPRLRLRSVRDRLYRGACLSDAHWNQVLDRFRDRKADVYALYEQATELSERYRKDTLRYLDDFYEIINDRSKVTRELKRRCQVAEKVR